MNSRDEPETRRRRRLAGRHVLQPDLPDASCHAGNIPSLQPRSPPINLPPPLLPFPSLLPPFGAQPTRGVSQWKNSVSSPSPVGRCGNNIRYNRQAAGRQVEGTPAPAMRPTWWTNVVGLQVCWSPCEAEALQHVPADGNVSALLASGWRRIQTRQEPTGPSSFVTWPAEEEVRH